MPKTNQSYSKMLFTNFGTNEYKIFDRCNVMKFENTYG